MPGDHWRSAPGLASRHRATEAAVRWTAASASSPERSGHPDRARDRGRCPLYVRGHRNTPARSA